jgi:DNA modification methylase
VNVEQVDIGRLKPDPENARKHSKRNLDAIAESLRQFGQQRAAVIRSDGTVLAGNGMLDAARALGWTQVAVTVVPDEWTDDQARAYALADNRTAELAEWDGSILDDHLQTLIAAGWDVGDLGFDPIPSPLPDEDEVPELPVDPVSKAGDIWQLGKHYLLCGSSTDSASIGRLFDISGKPDVLVTDPPYGIGYEYNSHDDSSNENNAQLVADAFANGPQIKIWTPGLHNLARDISRFGQSKVVAWSKKFAGAGNGLGGASTWEPVLIAGKPNNRALKNDVIEVMTDRETVDGVPLRDLHSCPKPVELYKILIESLTLTDEIIYEPFCGSGTTLIAAESSGRRCVAVELDPAYCDVIVRRWELFANRTATKLNAEGR